MPYSNVPAAQTAAMESCVKKVMRQGMPRERAIAICHKSVIGGGKKKKEQSASLPDAPQELEVQKDATDADDDEAAIEKMYGEPMAMDVYGGPTTFAELDAQTQALEIANKTWNLTDQFYTLVGNIMLSPEVDDKAAAVKALANEFADRVEDEAGEIQKKDASGGLIDRIAAAVKEAIGIPALPPPEPATPRNGFFLWKEKDGTWRWFAVYSNKYEDRETEILSEKAHQTFVELVDAGAVPYPELWHWHVPGSRWGVADWLALTKGFALATGVVNAGHEAEAEVLAARNDVRVSHGMPTWSVIRNPENPRVIDFYVSKEISDLPASKAANPLTQFVVLKEVATMLPQEKKDYLKSVGLADDVIAQIEANLERMTKEAEAAGLASKEQKAEGATTVDQEPAGSRQTAQAAAPAYATRDEVAEALTQALTPLTETLTAIRQGLEAVQLEVKTLKASDEDKIAEKAQGTPALSLAALVAQRLSVVGNEATRVDGRSTLAKDGPKETAVAGVRTVNGAPVPGLIGQLVEMSRHPAGQ